MKVRRFALGVGVVVALTLLGLAAWSLRPPPRLDVRRVDALAHAGRFDAAEAVVRDHLRRAAADADAHFRLAQLMLERPDREGAQDAWRGLWDEALRHLDRVPDEPKDRAALASVYRGRAWYRLDRWDRAEAAWLDALRRDSRVPIAGWALLDLYYLQGRGDEARRLALRLHRVEPEPRDRVNLLLELVRQDAFPPDGLTLAQRLEPVVEANPADVHTAAALGLALVRSSQSARGLDVLRENARCNPGDPDAWAGLLAGLDEADPTALDAALAEVPTELAASPRFARYRAQLAQRRGDLAVAIEEYRRAVVDDPLDRGVTYRLARVLRLAGQAEEADRIDSALAESESARRELRAVYEEANAERTLGLTPHPDLYRRIARIRERMGRDDEARAWYRLVLADAPDDPDSRTALRRLDHRPPRGS